MKYPTLFRGVTTFLILLTAAPFVFAADPAPDAAAMDKARMDAAIQFAETVLQHGRDTYGEKHTPLISDMIEVDTLKAPEKMYMTRVGRPGPRQNQPWQSVIQSDLSFQGNLMRFLAGLSQLTGNPKYKEAYKDCIRYYFQHYRSENGLLQMGHHRFIDLNKDQYDGNDWPPGSSGHEIKGDYPYYELFWETDPHATRKMLTSHWNAHIKDWNTMDFTRHGRYEKKYNEEIWDRPMGEPVKGIVKGDLTFFDSGSDIIWAGGKLAQLNRDERPLAWTKRLFARYVDNAHPKTGIPSWHHTSLRVFGAPGESWPEYASLFEGASDALFGSGAIAMLRLGDVLGENGAYFRESVREYLKAYAKYAYNPTDNTLRYILYDGRDLSVGDRGASPGSIWKAGAKYMISYALCFRQSNDTQIWDILRSMCRGNDLGDIGEPGGKAPKLNPATTQSDPGILFALVEIFRATENRAYLDLARVIGNNALKQRFNAKQGLFTPTELHRVANVNATEPLAFLILEAALRGKLDQVPTYDGSTIGDIVDYLRPTKVLPYHPTASNCSYPDTVLASCDELVPGNSSDSKIPRMTWQNWRHAKGKVVATFPDILEGPATITGLNDVSDAKNWLSGMIIDSPFSYTFSGGQLGAAGDFTLTVLQGDHRWQEGSWMPAAWTPSGNFDFVMDIAAGARFTFAAALFEYSEAWHNGAGLIKNGEGTAVVTADYGPRYAPNLGDSRAYRRPTVVNGGVLLVNNATGSGTSPRSTVEVNDGGTLGGNGAIGNGGTWAIVTVHAGGTIAPGNGAGTLTFRDGLTLQDGAKLAYELGTNGDLVKVTGGTFTSSGKGGVKVSVADSGGLVVGNTYDLIDWSGAVLSGIDAGDLLADKAGNYSGKFQISGSKLQITITGKTTSAAEGGTPGIAGKAARAGAGAKASGTNTWINPKGGNWADNANWYGSVIPNGKNREWVQYNFEKPRKVSGVGVYWVDDKGDYRVPESWRVWYRRAGEWQPVEASGEYGVAKDRFNEVRFNPMETDSLRLEVKLQPGVSGGILEWRVSP